MSFCRKILFQTIVFFFVKQYGLNKTKKFVFQQNVSFKVIFYEMNEINVSMK